MASIIRMGPITDEQRQSLITVGSFTYGLVGGETETIERETRFFDGKRWVKAEHYLGPLLCMICGVPLWRPHVCVNPGYDPAEHETTDACC